MSDPIRISELINPENLIILPPETIVTEASRKMLDCHVGLVTVVENDLAVGIVTERDINYRVIAQGRDANTTRLTDIMSRNPVLISPDTNVFDALKLVVRNFFRYALVGVERHVVGVVPISSIFAEVTKAMGNDIVEIDGFIRGDSFAL